MKNDEYQWIVDLKPDQIIDMEESICYDWFERSVSIEIYENSEVVAIAPCEGNKKGFCEVNIKDREWITNFITYGWSDNNPNLIKIV